MLIWVEIGAACYRTEKAQIPKSGGAGTSAGKSGTAGGSAGNSAGRTVLLGKAEEWLCSQQSPPAVQVLGKKDCLADPELYLAPELQAGEINAM